MDGDYYVVCNMEKKDAKFYAKNFVIIFPSMCAF